MSDPYLYPGTNTLINRMGITNPEKLQDLEAAIYRLKIAAPLPSGHFNYDHLKKIHEHLFGELYSWAGCERTVDISKSESHFARHEFIRSSIDKVFKKLNVEQNLQGLGRSSFCERLSFYFNEINASHPFREGNGRSLRAFCDVLAQRAGFHLEWSKVSREAFIEANVAGFNGHEKPMAAVFLQISSPLNRSQFLDLAKEIINPDIAECLKSYLEKQIQFMGLTNTMRLTNTDESIDVKMRGEASQLDKEVKAIATRLNSNEEIKSISNQPQIMLALTANSFNDIAQRIQNKKETTQDLLTVLWHATTTASEVTRAAEINTKSIEKSR